MSTHVIRVPPALVNLIKTDHGENAAPGLILQKVYEEYRMLDALARVLRDGGFEDGDTTFDLIKNYVAYTQAIIIDLRKDLETCSKGRQEYEEHFKALWSMFLKGDALGIRTTLPVLLTGRMKAVEHEYSDDRKMNP